MSEIISQNPPPEDPKTVRQAIITQFADLKQKAEAVAAERVAAEPEAESESEGATAEPEVQPEPEPVPATTAAVQPKKAAGRPSFEQRMRNIQSIQDKRFNEQGEVLQQLANAVAQIQHQLTTSQNRLTATETEEELPAEYQDPNLLKAIEREAEKVLQKKYGLNPRSAASLQRNSIIAEYRAINRDYAEYDPAVTAVVNRLPENIPISVELLTSIKQGVADVLWGAFQAWNQSNQPAQAGAVTGQNTQLPNQDGQRQITHDQASALRAQARSLRTETGENVGANMQVEPADVRQALQQVLRGRRGGVPR